MSTFRKALSAGVLAAGSLIVGGWSAGHVSWGQILAALGAGVVAGVAVYQVPNAAQPAK